jgi:hypothetical protein
MALYIFTATFLFRNNIYAVFCLITKEFASRHTYAT